MHSKLIDSLPERTDREIKALMENAKAKDVNVVLEAATKELSKRHPILANNCRGFEHESEYGLRAVIDCIPEQLGKIAVSEIKDIVRFQYEGSEIRIDRFTDCTHKDVTIINNGAESATDHAGKEGVCFYGDKVEGIVVTKEKAANLYPSAFNVNGDFCQFTFKRM